MSDRDNSGGPDWREASASHQRGQQAGLTKALPIVEFGALRESGEHFVLQICPSAINETAQVVIASRAF